MAATLCPSSWLMRVDLPAFGVPITAALTIRWPAGSTHTPLPPSWEEESSPSLLIFMVEEGVYNRPAGLIRQYAFCQNVGKKSSEVT